MKGKENKKFQAKMSFNDKLAVFDKNKKNIQSNKNTKKEKKDDKKINCLLEKKLQLFQPKKSSEANNHININDSKKRGKMNDIKKVEKLNKSNISNKDNGKIGKEPKTNKNEYNNSKINNVTHFSNNNVSEKIKKMNENEDKSKYNRFYERNTTNNIKSFNNLNNINNKSNINKSKNTSNKEIKKLENMHTQKKNKFKENVKLFSQNSHQNQKKEVEQKQINNKTIKDRIAFFNKDINKTNENNKKYVHNNKNNNINNKSNYNENQKDKKEGGKHKINNPIKNEANNKNLVQNNNIYDKKNQKEINQNNIINNKINDEISKEEEIPLNEDKLEIKKEKTEDINNILEEYFILDEHPINSEEKTNSFCKSFFIISLPKKNNKIIENSEGTVGDCGHKYCSLLPSLEPNIIYKYPENDSKELELDNILSDICFPNYIKLCYFEDEDKIYSLKNYRGCFTNQVGDRYYAMTYHFYVRITNSDFYKIYDCTLFENLVIKYRKEIEENLEEGVKLINDINNIKYVYIPYCFCLISKYPYFNQMEKSLQSVVLTIKNKNLKNDELNKLISYIVKSIPSPYIHSSVSFPITNCYDMIELNYPFYQELLLQGDNLMLLLDKLTISNIILLFRLLLFEQKILLVSNDYNDLTQLSLNLISLLYPFSWIHIYIPIITGKMLKYLESFLPYLNGMNKTLYERENVKQTIYSSDQDLYIFDIDKNSLEISHNLNGNKKESAIKFLNKNVPSFPKKIENIITNQLNSIKSNYKKKDLNNIGSLNIKMKIVFLQVFIEILYDYKSYLTFIEDLPIFNNNTFISERPEIDMNFYKELMNTQLFQMFIQNSLNYENYFFDELIKEYPLNKKEKNENNKYYINLQEKLENNLYSIKTHYIIIPSFFKFKPMEQKLNSQKGKYLIENMNNHIKAEFKEKESINENGILKENKRIIYNEINISNKNDVKELQYYITQEEIIESEKDNKKENKKVKNNKNTNKNKLNNESEIKEEELRDNIRAILKHVFKSEHLNIIDDINSLSLALENEYGRKYFTEIIKLNNKNKEIKIINEDSFKILSEVISKTLSNLHSNKEEIIYGIKFIKFCYYFKKRVNKIEYLLNERIFEILTKKYNLFNQIYFWELWIEDELNKNDVEILNKYRKKNSEKDSYIYIDEEEEEIIKFKEIFKKHLKEIKQIMMKIKLNKSFILTVIDYFSNKYNLDDEYKKEQVIELMNRYTIKSNE